MSATLAKRDYRTDALSAGQQDYIKSLLGQIAEIWPGMATKMRGHLNEEYRNHTLTGERASKWIDSLKSTRDELRARQRQQEAELRQQELDQVPAPRVTEPRPDVPSGRYAIETEEGKLGFYRVTNKDGHYRVFVFASTAQHLIQGWKAQLAILRKIESAGIEQAGIRFGLELGICGKCGTALTDEESRRLGIGPICGGRRSK